MNPESALDDIVRFHGHGGPWAALGYMAGHLAKEMLKPERMKDMKAHVDLKYEIPYSCFLDGLQVGSCCTVGKKNFTFSDGDGVPVSSFHSGDKSLVIRIKEGTLEKIIPASDDKTVWVLSQDPMALFDVR